MKTFNFIAVLFLTSLLFASCENSEADVLANDAPIPLFAVGGPGRVLRKKAILHRNGASIDFKIWCETPAGNCYDDVVITASIQGAYDNFLEAYNNDNVVEYFSTNDYQLVFPDMDGSGILSQVLNGSVTLHLFQNFDSDDLDYYFALPSTTEFSQEDDSWSEDVLFVF